MVIWLFGFGYLVCVSVEINPLAWDMQFVKRPMHTQYAMGYSRGRSTLHPAFFALALARGEGPDPGTGTGGGGVALAG